MGEREVNKKKPSIASSSIPFRRTKKAMEEECGD